MNSHGYRSSTLALRSKPPPNYVAGLGRGATGFTTRSDIGPARSAPDLAAVAKPQEEESYDEDQKSDEFEGNDLGLFAFAEYDEDDREADRVWEAIDKSMDSRRKDRREARLKQEIEKYRSSNPKITEQFTDLKTRGRIETARAIYDHALTVFLTKKSIWLKASQLEKSHGTRESLDALLRRAVTYRPQAEVLWLMGAKEKWLAGDVPAARAILQEAYATIPNSEEIWLAAFKLEFENHEPERAKMLLAKARDRGGKERVWMKSAIVERELGDTTEERRLLDEGLKLFFSFFKLWLMLGQLEERLGRLQQAKGAYETGLKHCPNCVPLWLSLADLEEKMSRLSKARAVLTMARKRNPQNPELWLAAVRSEYRHGSKKEADNLMAKALQECPNSGILWAESIKMVPHPQMKMKLADALKKCGQDPHVIAAEAKLFWHDRRVDKARSRLNRAVTLAPDVGDFWVMCYKLELQHGDEESQKDVIRRRTAAEPKHGEKWQTISKAVENSHQPTEAILKEVVVALVKEESAAENHKN